MDLAQIIGIAITVVGAFFGALWGLGRLVVAQFNKSLDTRFTLLDEARKEGSKALEERFRRMEEKQDATDQDVRKVLIELPREYVRREDFVRTQSIIEAKLDSLALRIENAVLKGSAQ